MYTLLQRSYKFFVLQLRSFFVVWPSWLSSGTWKDSLIETEVRVASMNCFGTFGPSDLDVAFLCFLFLALFYICFFVLSHPE